MRITRTNADKPGRNEKGWEVSGAPSGRVGTGECWTKFSEWWSRLEVQFSWNSGARFLRVSLIEGLPWGVCLDHVPPRRVLWYICVGLSGLVKGRWEVLVILDANACLANLSVCMSVCMNVCVCVYLYLYIYTRMSHIRMYVPSMYVCKYVSMHVCMYACMDVCTYLCIYACMYAWHACIYIYIIYIRLSVPLRQWKIK